MKKQTYMQSAPALGSEIELRLVAENAETAERWFTDLWKTLFDFQNRFSRFKAESEVTRFNQRSGEKVSISEEFRALLRAAEHFADLTEGAFNPFVLPNLQRAGYVASLTDADTVVFDYSDRDIADNSFLEIGEDWACIPKNTAIDLGGIGKGYLADALGAVVGNEIESFCFSLGGDMYVRGADVDGPWKIDIQSAADRTKDYASYVGTGNAFGIATSGVVREKNGQTVGHLIDPTTGLAVDVSPALCTVVAEDATTADVMASCVLMRGKEYASRIVEQGVIQAVLLQNGAESPFSIGEGFSLQQS